MEVHYESYKVTEQNTQGYSLGVVDIPENGVEKRESSGNVYKEK